jgi:hypothetical protein
MEGGVQLLSQFLYSTIWSTEFYKYRVTQPSMSHTTRPRTQSRLRKCPICAKILSKANWHLCFDCNKRSESNAMFALNNTNVSFPTANELGNLLVPSDQTVAEQIPVNTSAVRLALSALDAYPALWKQDPQRAMQTLVSARSRMQMQSKSPPKSPSHKRKSPPKRPSPKRPSPKRRVTSLPFDKRTRDAIAIMNANPRARAGNIQLVRQLFRQKLAQDPVAALRSVRWARNQIQRLKIGGRGTRSNG